MFPTASSYRPHNSGHDYYEAGAYLITLVVTERQPSLSTLGTNPRSPSVELLPVGRIVQEEWERTETIQRSRGRFIETRCQICMPDHWHGVIIVRQRLDKSLGSIIQAFKSACTARWRREVTGYVEPASTTTLISHLGQTKRRTYYASRPLIERPFFDDDYDDTICLSAEHLQRMMHYVADNPRRAIMRRMFPQFMQKCLHIRIAGTDYAAFGNLFLLRWVRKEQVFCHRMARLGQLSPTERQQYGYTYAAAHELTTRVPYETTMAFRQEHDQWIAHIMEGATVLVTPGISRGEQLVKNECLQRHLPLIHLQKEPISRYWKPERQRFEACASGNLLILAPWTLDDMDNVRGIPSTTDFSRFHNLNILAAQLCAFNGEAQIIS